MSSFKEKSVGFIIGIMVGLIVAGGFFVLKLDDYFKELSFYKSISNSDTKNEVDSSAKDIKKKQITEKKEKLKSAKLLTEEIKQEKIETPEVDTIEAVKKDTVISGKMESEEIIVRKDELLSTKTIEVINLDPVVKMNSKDSLLQKVSGIKADSDAVKQFMNMEFWSSPLNYKGYRMGKYKLVLYGISSAEGLKLFKLEDIIYLKNGSNFYRLTVFNDFRPYERVTDESIISRLK